ncbi:unnamed protein product, partial [Ixodes hexagonus]
GGSRSHQDLKWDEMNILKTLHPPDKDYGHMKIDEAKTPYSYDIADDRPAVDPALLAQKYVRKILRIPQNTKNTPKHPERKKKYNSPKIPADELSSQFELRRKLHYNEGSALKRGGQRLEEDDDDED